MKLEGLKVNFLGDSITFGVETAGNKRNQRKVCSGWHASK